MDFMKAMDVIFRYKIFSTEEEKEESVTAVDGVTLSIQKGDFVGILGHNGSGKSTLAKQLAGLLLPTEGCIYINGMDTRKEKHNIAVRKTAGIVFQNPDNQLIGNVVEEDIAFGPENLGVPMEDIWTRVADALEATGMSAYRFRSPKALSGGQKQKIAISGMLAMEPECLILDEPTAMLDPKGRKEVLEAIGKLNQEKGITIILITHHMEEAENADYLYVMKEGRVMASGTPSQIWKQTDMLEDCGIGLPFDRQLINQLHARGIHLPDEYGLEEMAEWLTGGLYDEEDALHHDLESFPEQKLSDAGQKLHDQDAGQKLHDQRNPLSDSDKELSNMYSRYQLKKTDLFDIDYSLADKKNRIAKTDLIQKKEGSSENLSTDAIDHRSDRGLKHE